jgi:hypothetical protein
MEKSELPLNTCSKIEHVGGYRNFMKNGHQNDSINHERMELWRPGGTFLILRGDLGGCCFKSDFSTWQKKKQNQKLAALGCQK